MSGPVWVLALALAMVTAGAFVSDQRPQLALWLVCAAAVLSAAVAVFAIITVERVCSVVVCT